jgi:hypothetical protein
VPAGWNAVTTFNSWQGIVNPPSPFNNELGNRIHFGLHAVGVDGTTFTLDSLTFSLTSSDPSNSLAYSGNFTGTSYNGTTRVGVIYNPDGSKTFLTSDNGTTPVNEIDYIGVGNAWWPGGDDPNPGNPAGGPQLAMDNYYNNSGFPITISCTYSLDGYSGSASVVAVPEPGTLALLAVAGLGMLCYAWKRRS